LARGVPVDGLTDRVLEPIPVGADQVVHLPWITQVLDDLNMPLAYSPKSLHRNKGNPSGIRTDCKPRANNRLFRGEKGVSLCAPMRERKGLAEHPTCKRLQSGTERPCFIKGHIGETIGIHKSGMAISDWVATI
jgi:hypothetical protein